MKLLEKLFVGATLALALMLPSSAEFARTACYTAGQFADVSAEEWYASDVQSVYELGFMNGTQANTFSPEENVSVAQGVVMAARMHALYHGNDVPANDPDGAWYASAVQYAKKHGFVREDEFDSFERPMTRREMAILFYDAFPNEYYTPVNEVVSIPDVSSDIPGAEKLLSLYRAGIVMGSDAYGSFHPDTYLARCECAAILNRVALPENRLHKTLKVLAQNDAYTLCYNESYDATKEGINSGWILDNRGGSIRTGINGGYGTLADVSEEFGTAMIREFNLIRSGRIVVETVLSVSGNGVFVEFRDEDEQPVYQLKSIDNAWQVLLPNGTYTPVLRDALTDQKSLQDFPLRLVIDLDEGTAHTYIRDIDCGISALLSDNILSFRYATDEKSVVLAKAGIMNMVANYAVYESFTHFGAKDVYGWTTSGSINDSGELTLEAGSSAQKAFTPRDGKVCLETYFILPQKNDHATVTLYDGEAQALSFALTPGSLTAGEQNLYKLSNNMWYRLRVEADTGSKLARVLLNGRTIGTVPMTGEEIAIDSFCLTSEAGSVRFDNLRVYNLYLHGDYVPRPTDRASFDDYTVGVNVCSLWRNGTHFGWSCITPYDEPKPVLGYYDEGLAETADWEIKYMVEHGIDFQAFCWFADLADAPIKEPTNSAALHDGYMYATYSDYMKYCLIWEAANGRRFHAEQFRNNVIPYWFENYFLDDRYLTIDNKLMLYIFGTTALADASYFGSIENAKVELDYLNEVAKSYGFDGVILVSTIDGQPAPTLASMGIDAAAAYNWGTDGKTLEKNTTSILKSAAVDSLYTIPTVSVGFDSIPWHGKRYGNMTTSDFAAALEWVKSDYLPKYSTPGSWNDGLVMISTWNEYGEGTYIMPSGLNGFGYLDALRKAFTSLPEEHIDPVPSAAQAERIGHLYPQYARLLRKEGWYEEQVDDTYEAILSLAFEKDAVSVDNVQSATVTYDENGLSATSSSNDPAVYFPKAQYLNIDAVTHLALTMKAPAGSAVEVFFTTAESANLDQEKTICFTTDSSDWKTYVIEIENKAWKGELLKLRIDPVKKTDIAFSLSTLELYRKKPEAQRTLYINGIRVENTLPATITDTDVYFPFDPATGVNFLLNCVYSWNKEAGMLKIDANHHTVTYTVGSDRYLVDGVEKQLTAPVETLDGLPMLSFHVLSEALDYSYEALEYDCYVRTAQSEQYEAIRNRAEGAWEFNEFDTMSWSSMHMSMYVADGSMTLANLSDSNFDPSITYAGKLELVAEKYKTFELRCRYQYARRDGKTDGMKLYFATDRSPGFSEEKAVSVAFETTDTGDEWKTYSIELKQNAAWKDAITALRFDPFNAVGYMEIDYMRFVEDPDYVYIDPNTLPFTVENGDAQDRENVAFHSHNATVSIVSDPDNSENAVYAVTAKENKKDWTYFVQDVTYKKNKKYVISFDIRSMGDTSGDDKAGANLFLNLKYPDSGALNGEDHVIGHGIAVTSDTWTHVERECTVTSLDSQYGNKLTLYAEPNGEYAVSFMVDNVVVTEKEIEP